MIDARKRPPLRKKVRHGSTSEMWVSTARLLMRQTNIVPVAINQRIQRIKCYLVLVLDWWGSAASDQRSQELTSLPSFLWSSVVTDVSTSRGFL